MSTQSTLTAPLRSPAGKVSLAVAVAAFSGVICADPITDAISNGTPSLDTRYRYETVDEDTFADDARASTLRARLGYETAEVGNLKGYLEMEHVTSVGPENYNSTINGRDSRPIVADPTETELNQAYLAYNGLADTRLTIGRQRLKLDNDRFIGNVGWRQNEQTFDGTTLINTSLPDTTITAGYLHNANRIVSDASPKGDLAMKTGILNGQYDGFDSGSLLAYSYLVALDNRPEESTQTYGLRYTGNAPLTGSLNALYTLEYAHQSDYDDNTRDLDQDYYMLEAGVDYAGVQFKLGQEVLGSDDGAAAFQTPLATLHAFNGFTDRFLSTPDAGLVDRYTSLSGTLNGVALMAVYHEFDSDEGSGDYGSEAALQATYRLNETYTLGAKYATYDADGFSQDSSAAFNRDTDKGWLWVQASF
ncbi:alginate export family protein [Vreelandella utahensis]|uniref:alginate export family protein n=1 Tax=Vreelandella halophila TaxID=86177 RepID=UPI0009850F45|nr:alginate export family protein [Halomonas utahensis]